MYTILIAVVAAIVWAACSYLMHRSIEQMREGSIYERIQVNTASKLTIFFSIFFAPLIFLKGLLEWLCKQWAYLLIIAVIVWACTPLSGCQVSIVTAPHATFMVDSVTAESIDQGIYERNAE